MLKSRDMPHNAYSWNKAMEVYCVWKKMKHYSDVTMCAIGSQITSLTTVYSAVYSDAVQRKHQSSASLAFVRGIHRWPVNSPHKWRVTRKSFFHLMTSSWYQNFTTWHVQVETHAAHISDGTILPELNEKYQRKIRKLLASTVDKAKPQRNKCAFLTNHIPIYILQSYSTDLRKIIAD